MQKPGREIDALVAEKVMGLKVVKTVFGKQKQYCHYTVGEPDYYDDQGATTLHNPVPEYSFDIAAAWEVVSFLTKKYNFKIANSCTTKFLVEFSSANRGVALKAETAPLAICNAALRFMEND